MQYLKIVLGILLIIGCTAPNNKLFAQKHPLDTSADKNWPIIKDPGISNDGHYIAYIKTSDNSAKTLVIQDTSGKWKKEITSVVGNCQFTGDSRRVMYTLPNDSLALLELGTSTITYVKDVDGYPAPEMGNGRWLAFKLKGDQHDLMVMDLQQNTETKYPGTGEFEFSPGGDIIIMQTPATKNEPAKVYWLNLVSGKRICIGSGYVARRIAFDKTEQQLAYISVAKTNGDYKMALCYYRPGADSAKVLVDNATPGMEGMSVTVGSLNVSFSKLGDKIFFAVTEQTELAGKAASPPITGVQVQNYNSDLIAYKNNRKPRLAVINLKNAPKVVKLQQNNDDGYEFRLGGGGDDDYIAVSSDAYGDAQESKWRITALPNIYLVSTADGSRKLVKSRLECNSGNLAFSPGGKYLTWYDKARKNWFTYNPLSGATTNITQSITCPVYQLDDHPRAPMPEGIAGWLENDKAILIYDRYDIWKVDPSGKLPPVNITGNYGIKHNTMLRILNFDNSEIPVFHNGDRFVVSALDLDTKNNGFFKLTLTAGSQLRKLTMRPEAYYYAFTSYTTIAFSGKMDVLYNPLKAKNANVYVLVRMSATEYPNLNITSDFIHFSPITNLTPQKAYNWYTNELVHWKLPDGEKAEGVLYKPENFDPKKKYPVIFFYYARSADALNLYLKPELSFGSINIPWFVSNGYLVFVPDIYYKTGYMGESAYNCVVSAALNLSKQPWVDAHKMGLQGHSFGGYETNYIVTKTHLFAAAAPAAGFGDYISSYGHDHDKWFFESGNARVGASLWQRPDLYIKNSPIFNEDKITTPLFIMHNSDDGNVIYFEGEEWYNNLVRLNKKAWTISYTGETHSIENPVHQLDYTVRLAQFFDYYLKGALPPKWMTENTDSLELDHSGKKP